MQHLYWVRICKMNRMGNSVNEQLSMSIHTESGGYHFGIEEQGDVNGKPWHTDTNINVVA